MTNKKHRTTRVKLTPNELAQLDLFFTDTLATNSFELHRPTVGIFPPDIAAVRYANCLHAIYDSDPETTPPQSEPSKIKHLPTSQQFSAITDDPQPTGAGE